ncbi:MAG: hypothetical protein M1504_00860 [Candidatus Marsarchaeota archaeon]|nr:hypothetical protein [Candidatus Marsarchaeota archaeon]
MLGARKVVSFDIDGTIVNTLDNTKLVVNRLFGVDVNDADIRKLGLTKSLYMLNREQILMAFSEVWKRPEEIRLIDPSIPGCIDEIKSNGYDIAILTASYGEDRFIKRVLAINNISYDNYYHVNDQLKKKDANVDIHADDSITVINSFAAANRPSMLLLNWWNEDRLDSLPNSDVLYKCKDWKEMTDLLCSDGLQK